jgi:CcmD family protein
VNRPVQPENCGTGELGGSGARGSGTGEVWTWGTGELGSRATRIATASTPPIASNRPGSRIIAPRVLVWLLAASCLLMPAADRPAHAQGQQPRPPAAQDEFVPVDKLPTEESLPATPLVLVAYAVAWLAVLVYLFSIWRRMGRVEREIAEIARRVQQRSGG